MVLASILDLVQKELISDIYTAGFLGNNMKMRFDYIIIGAGSAGSVLANRLSGEAASTVLLLEAGGKNSRMDLSIPGAYSMLFRTSVDWAYWTEPQPFAGGRRIFIPRGKTLGGSSSINAMAYVRGNRADFDEWESLGNKGWGYESVLPYFKKSEKNADLAGEFHGKDGLLHVQFSRQPSRIVLPFLKACAESGIPYNDDYNGSGQWGASPLQFTIRHNRRHSAADAFLKPVDRRPNLKILTHARVHRILLEKGKATGVEFLSRHGTLERAFCNREIILSAGSISSPQILMLSGIGDPDHLKEFSIKPALELPGVGKNLQDHLWCGASSLSRFPSSNNDLKAMNRLKVVLTYLLFRKGALGNSPIEANAFFSSSSESERPDLQFHFVPAHIGNDYSTDIYDLKTYPKSAGYSIMAILLRPESRGQVLLRSADPVDFPVIEPNFFHEPADGIRLVKGLRKAISVLASPAFDEFRKGGIFCPVQWETDEDILLHIRKSFETLYHPVGTCKMGNDSMAVVGEKLQVHGIPNLRVIDASIMPTITSGNTNAPVIMIAEKGADMITGKC